MNFLYLSHELQNNMRIAAAKIVNKQGLTT